MERSDFMGLFNYYTTEAPEIDATFSQKHGISLFFDTLFRKFFKLIKVNWLYFLFSIPYFAIILFCIAPIYTEIFAPPEIMNDAVSCILYNLLFTGLIFNFMGAGPTTAPYSYLIRSYISGTYVWVFSDGLKKLKENFKQSVIVCLVDIAVLFIMSIAMLYYKINTGYISILSFYFCLGVLLLYAISHTFIYQIMITYECTLKTLIQNAIVLLLKKLPMCILLSLLGVVVCYLLIGYFGTIGLIAYITFGMLVAKFPLEFYAATVINLKKHEEI